VLDAATPLAPTHLGHRDRDEDAVTYTCVLPVPRRAVRYVADLLAAHQRQLRTRQGRRALDCWDQAVAFWRWMLDGVEPDRLASDYGIGRSTAHRDVHEALDVVADRAPSLHGALLAARAAGHTHVNLDGTLVHTDRVSTPGPTTARARTRSGPQRCKVDLFWSGKHHCHGGNVQVVTAPDGWPLWVSPVRPGREHDITAARHDPQVLATLEQWCDQRHGVLADLGYEGERDVLTLPVRTETNGLDRKGNLKPLTADQGCLNALHSATRARAEQGNARLKQTFKILRKVRVDPWRIGALAAAALVMLHVLYDRTT
jgi:hypothetical protein